MPTRKSVIVAAVVLAAAFVFPGQAMRLARSAFETALPGHGTALVGPTRHASVELLAEVHSLHQRILGHMDRREPLPAAIVDRLEALMQPDQPYEVRGRAMRIGHVIGARRFERIVLAAMHDPNPIIRRFAIDKANQSTDLAPAVAPAGIAADPDSSVRNAYRLWIDQAAVRGAPVRVHAHCARSSWPNTAP